MKSSIARRLIKPIAVGALIFYAFSGVSSLLNYAFYPVISRFVSIEEYGEIQFLVSMFTQLAVGFVVLNILAIIIGTEIKNSIQQKSALRSLNIVASGVSALIVIIGSTVLVAQQDNLGITSNIAIIALGLSLLINVPFTIAVGKLQGNNQFVASGVVSMLGALLKLIFSVVFVMLGYGVAGALFGIFAGMTVSLVIIEIINLRTKPHEKLNFTSKRFLLFSKHHFTQLSFVKNRAAVALIAVTVITLLSAADSITSRIVLSASDAGHYASVATIAKIILAATSPLMWLALPPALQHSSKVIFKYIFLALMVSVIATICFSIAPLFFTQTIIGVDPKQFQGLVPIASIGMTLCAIGFIVLTATICMGYLKTISITLIVTVISYFATIILLSPSSGSLVASLIGQVVASTCLILGLLPKLFTTKNNS